jgi:hypothetical protein
MPGTIGLPEIITDPPAPPAGRRIIFAKNDGFYGRSVWKHQKS